MEKRLNMKKWIYVHHSNLLIQAQHLSAVLAGPGRESYQDETFAIDVNGLWELLTSAGHDQVGRLVLCGSKPPQNKGLWHTAEKLGFEIYVVDRFHKNEREKKIDAWMVASIFKDACERIDRDKDRIVLVTGDSDFVPAVELLIEDGFKVDVIFWTDASLELRLGASSFTPLDEHLEFLRLSHPQGRRVKAKRPTI